MADEKTIARMHHARRAFRAAAAARLAPPDMRAESSVFEDSLREEAAIVAAFGAWCWEHPLTSQRERAAEIATPIDGSEG